MFRKVLSTLALGMVLVAPAAHADPPYQANFWFNSAGGAHDYQLYQGSFDNADFFQIFCVNPQLNVNDGELYANAWITPFNAGLGNGGNAINPNGNTFLGNYYHAAELASLMVGNVFTPTEVISLQHAIWGAMGFTFGHPLNATADDLAYWDLFYDANGFAIDADNWFIITDVNEARQEFISFVDTPFETVPEPATMTLLATGLAGMAAARRRRNKKN